MDMQGYPKEESFATFIWNSETKEFLGRTGASWGKISIFYLIFYAFLAGFMSVIMVVFYQTLDLEVNPTYTPGDGSSILRNPALGFRPLPRKENVESTLIWYKNGDNDDIKHWTDSLDEFIEPYEGNKEVSGQHVIDCRDDNLPDHSQVCRFSDKWLQNGNCHKAEKWGYNRESPCIILKLNKMIGWTPDTYDDPEDLPSNMPQSLKDHIKNESLIMDSDRPKKMIWVSCEGENPADREYIGDIKYYPYQGFPAYYFPYRNTPGYMPPIVGVELKKPQSNVLINIECRAWARNIVHSRQKRLGLVHFEVLKD